MLLTHNWTIWFLFIILHTSRQTQDVISIIESDYITQLHRIHRTSTFRLRTYVHHIKKEQNEKYDYRQYHDETIDHFLLHCPLCDIRIRLPPAQPTIHNTQYGSTTQLPWTATYSISVMNRCSHDCQKCEGDRKVKR